MSSQTNGPPNHPLPKWGRCPRGARSLSKEAPPISALRAKPTSLAPLGEDVCVRSQTKPPPNRPLPRSGGGAERSEAEGAHARVSREEPPPTSALRAEPTSPSDLSPAG